MKKSNLLLNLLLAVLLIGGFTACNEDEPGIDPGEGVQVGDGLYITQNGIDPVGAGKLVPEVVEDDGFASKDREGFFANYVYLTAGDYTLVNVIAKEITQALGGTATALTHETGNCEVLNYTLVEAVADGAAFEVASEGLYKVAFDTDRAEIVLAKMTNVGIVGSATTIGWDDAGTVDLPGSVTSDGGSWTASSIILRKGVFKMRMNCNWVIDRRDEGATDHDFENGYVIYTNLGGIPADLVTGGADMEVTDKGGSAPDEGDYTVTVTWNSTDGFTMTLTRDADAPELSFDPADWKWGAIGPATDGAWESDQQIPYVDWANGWFREFYLSTVVDADDQGFKFRSDDVWTNQLNNGNTTIVSDNTADFANSDGKDTWKLAGTAGLYYAAISTADEGETWALTLDRAIWGAIGDATPGGWDADTDLTAAEEVTGTITYTLTGATMTAGNFKFRLNDDWPRQLGWSDLTISGSSAGLLSDAGSDNNIALSTAGTYDLILTTTDHGETYSLEIN